MNISKKWLTAFCAILLDDTNGIVKAFFVASPRASKRNGRFVTNSNSFSGAEDAEEKIPNQTYESKIPFVTETSFKFESTERSQTKTDGAIQKQRATADSRPKAGVTSEKPKSIWETPAPVLVQGNSLRTWSFKVPYIDRVQILMKTEGRPLTADIDLWSGPDNTPQRMRVYIEDGNARPFSAIVETPGAHNAIAIRNTATLEYPLRACVEAELGGKDRYGVAPSTDLSDLVQNLAYFGTPRIVQGGAVYTKPFSPSVASVQILLNTAGRPLLARIEILQGPNNTKQVMEIYTEHGLERPFFVVVETPGVGNVVRIVNTGTLEYPMTAYVEPYRIDDSVPEGDEGGFFIIQ